MAQERIARVPFRRKYAVQDLWEKHNRGGEDYGLTLWKVLNFSAWYNQIVEPYSNQD